MSRFNAEFFADSRTRRRGSLDNDMFFRIIDGIPYLIAGVICSKRTSWTAINTLTAIYTDNICQWFIEKSSDMSFVSSIQCFEATNFLKVDTCSNASFTENAFIHVANNRSGRSVHIKFRSSDM